MPVRSKKSDDQAERLIRAAWRIFHGGAVTTSWIRMRFGVSKATAKRDVARLLRVLPVDVGPVPRPRGVLRVIARPRLVVEPLAMRELQNIQVESD
jgi:hypothetical protein